MKYRGFTLWRFLDQWMIYDENNNNCGDAPTLRGALDIIDEVESRTINLYAVQ